MFPHVGALPIRNVTAALLCRLLRRIEARAQAVALMVRQWISAVFRYAVATFLGRT